MILRLRGLILIAGQRVPNGNDRVQPFRLQTLFDRKSFGGRRIALARSGRSTSEAGSARHYSEDGGDCKAQEGYPDYWSNVL